MRFKKNVTIKLLFIIVALILFRYYGLSYIFDSAENGYSLFDNVADSFSSKEMDKQPCVIPKLKLNNVEINKYFYNYPLPTCNKDKNWIYVKNETFYIDDDAIKTHGQIVCDYDDIRRLTDYDSTSNVSKNYPSGSPIIGDIFGVHCTASDGRKYKNIHTSVKSSKDVVSRSRKIKPPDNGLNLNVYIFGFDSMSRLTFMRKLPKTYSYITKNLRGVVLEGYNIVGDGTPQALIPILTGKTEQELPNVKKQYKNAEYVNVFPFIWNEFRDAGYATLYGEDEPYSGVFNLRMKGFKEQPTDHYMRPFYVAAHSQKWFNKQYCWGSEPQHKVHFAYAEDFFTNYPRNVRKFAFHFHGAYSHDDINLIGSADDDIVEHLKFFVKKGFSNETFIMVMSDHGHRFASLRKTQQGKLEERLPFFSLILPPWFHDRYPLAMANLRSNVDRLTTPFDIYPTIKSILNFDSHPKIRDKKTRGISLFEEIPFGRTCEDAHVDTHWCTCLLWKPIKTSEKIVRTVAKQLVDKINSATAHLRNLCAPLKIESIDKASVYKPNKPLLKFKKSKTNDGVVPDFNGQTKFQAEYIQIMIRTTPGNGLFEASIIWQPNKNNTIVDLQDVSRINKYGNSSSCIDDKDSTLSKWCVCYNTF